MNPDSSVAVVLGAWLAISLIPAAIAERKGRSALVWWLFGLFMFVPALICAILIPEPPDSTVSMVRGCPSCNATINVAAETCPVCGAPVRRRATTEAVTATSPAAAAVSALDELARFASLRDKGAITHAEYDTQKARLLRPEA